MLHITNTIQIPFEEIEIHAVRAQGAGGQNVNKVSSAMHLRFDINNSSLPDSYKVRLHQSRDRRISKDGIIVIKAGRFRSQKKNREAAYERLRLLIIEANQTDPPRKPTRPSKTSRARRVDQKTKRGQLKRGRSGVWE